MTEVYIYADDDTFLDENFPNGNYGANPDVYLGQFSKSIEWRVLLRKDFSAQIPAGATIDDASLYMACGNIFGGTNGGTNYNGRRVRTPTRDWAEMQATWTIYKTANNWGTAGCWSVVTDYDDSVGFGPWTVVGAPGWRNVDCKTFLQDAVTNRSRVFDAVLYNITVLGEGDTLYHSFKSHDYFDDDFWWYILVNYTAEEPPPSGGRRFAHFVSRLGGVHLPALPNGWTRRHGLLVPAGS